MKKKYLSLIILLILITILFVLTGCSSNKNTTEKDEISKKVTKVGDLNLEFENGLKFSEGLAPICKNGKWGYIDTKGNLVIDYQFDNAFYFTEERAIVQKYEKMRTYR